MIPDFLLNPTFIGSFKDSLIIHHNLYTIPVSAIYHEEIFVNSARKAGYIIPDWKPGSHKKGSDVTVINETKKHLISCKGGTIDKNYLTISSHRTTEHKTIEEKIIFLNLNHQDGHCSLIYQNINDEHTYKYYWIPNNICKINNFTEQKGPRGGEYWIGNNDYGTKGKITKSMSDQLWLEIPLEICERIF